MRVVAGNSFVDAKNNPNKKGACPRASTTIRKGRLFASREYFRDAGGDFGRNRYSLARCILIAHTRLDVFIASVIILAIVVFYPRPPKSREVVTERSRHPRASIPRARCATRTMTNVDEDGDDKMKKNSWTPEVRDVPRASPRAQTRRFPAAVVRLIFPRVPRGALGKAPSLSRRPRRRTSRARRFARASSLRIRALAFSSRYPLVDARRRTSACGSASRRTARGIGPRSRRSSKVAAARAAGFGGAIS